LVVTAGPGGADWVVRRFGQRLEVVDQRTNTLVVSEPLADVRSLRLVGASGVADLLRIDFGPGGRFALAGGIRFEGGGDAGDTLRFLDGGTFIAPPGGQGGVPDGERTRYPAPGLPNSIIVGARAATFDGVNVTWDALSALEIEAADQFDTLRVDLPGGITRPANGATVSIAGLPFTFRATGIDQITQPTVPTVPTVPPTTPAVVFPGVVAAAGPGGGPRVLVFTPTGEVQDDFLAFEESFRGGVSLATADVNGDGIADLIVGAGAGGGPRVRVIDGVTREPIRDFFAFEETFRGGVNVAAGDLDGDGFADVVVGALIGGGPRVVAFSGKDGSLLANFFAYDSEARIGVRVAVADLDGDGKGEIVTGAFGGGPHVKVFSGTGEELQSFYAFEGEETGGVGVAAGDFDGNGKAEIAASSGIEPRIRVFLGNDNRIEFPAPDSPRGGATLAARDANGDGRADLMIGAGPGGSSAVVVRTLQSGLFEEISSLELFDDFLGGVQVG
jgi:hypothetical protein